ncbi:unnamed protein product, partial [Amoebophrya sp. A120]|eukprot:GSA120T00006803001.1
MLKGQSRAALRTAAPSIMHGDRPRMGRVGKCSGGCTDAGSGPPDIIFVEFGPLCAFICLRRPPFPGLAVLSGWPSGPARFVPVGFLRGYQHARAPFQLLSFGRNVGPHAAS